KWKSLASQNKSGCAPRECGPEQTKKEIDFGFSGLEMSNSAKPAGFKSFFDVWYATAIRLPVVSSEFERILAWGRSVWQTTFGLRGSDTSTAVKFFGALSWASQMMRRPARAVFTHIPSPLPPQPPT